jgi:hypothetical protein
VTMALHACGTSASRRDPCPHVTTRARDPPTSSVRDLRCGGAGVRNDPVLLWRHVAERLVGRPKDAFARTATALVLVSAAAGRIDGEQLAAVMTAAGWSARSGGGVHRYAVTSAAGHVDEVLDVVGAYEGRRQVTSAGRGLARAALQSR